MNFGLYPMLNRFKDFKYPWEKPYLEGSTDRIFRNTFADIEYILSTCAENGTRFEIECYDIGHLYTLAHFVDRGLVKAPLFVQSVFGLLGGIGPHPEDVLHMKRTADLLGVGFGELAAADPLTGLLNRRGFDEAAMRALAHARRHDEPVTLVVTDAPQRGQISEA